jgi:hypothetical protein
MAPVERCPLIRAKHQSIGIHSGWLASSENLDRLCPHGNRPLAAFALRLIGVTLVNALSHKFTAFQINVLPAQGQQFADP